MNLCNILIHFSLSVLNVLLYSLLSSALFLELSDDKVQTLQHFAPESFSI